MRYKHRYEIMTLISLVINLLWLSTTSLAQHDREMPTRHTLAFHDEEREYFVQNPKDIDPSKTYWLLVVVHGGGGNGRSYWLADDIKKAMNSQSIDAIIITPSFSNNDVQASRFPQLGEGKFLIKVIKDLKNKYHLHEKILLSGYSRGGQFSHRFAIQHPELVKACASFSAGSWTTPDGKFLMEGLEEISNPESFLSDTSNAALVPDRMLGMFEPRLAKVAGLQADEESKNVPFLIMCGTLDPRWKIAHKFAESLKIHGFHVLTSWPETPHKEREEYPWEFMKYSTNAVLFFSDAIGNSE